MISPYQNSNVGGGWGPPSGLIGQLIARDQANQQAAEQAGAGIGGLLSGFIGGAQAARNPEAFGAGTSKTGAFLRGFGTNVAASQSNGPNFKGIVEAGKAADSMRRALASLGVSTDILGDDHQFAAQGATEKARFMADVITNLNLKSKIESVRQQQDAAKAQLDEAAQVLAMRKIQQQQAQQQMDANRNFQQDIQQYGQAGSIMYGKSPVEQFQQAAMRNPSATVGTAMQQSMAAATDLAKMNRGEPQTKTINGTPVIYNAATGQFIVDPAYVNDIKHASKLSEITASQQANQKKSFMPADATFDRDPKTGIVYAQLSDGSKKPLRTPGEMWDFFNGGTSPASKAKPAFVYDPSKGELTPNK